MEKSRRNKRKTWNDKRSKKIQTKWYGRDKRIFSYKRLQNEEKIGKIEYNRKHQFLAEAPNCFSFIQNAEETISYFNRIIYVIEQKKLRQEFYLDASKISLVTTDALIYMIAVIYNIKANRVFSYSFTGNLPMNKEAKDVFEKSGYLNYFKIKRLQMPDSNEHIQIVSGKSVETDIAKRICDFVMEKLHTDRKHTKIIYATLVELMSNTAKHAYQKDNKKMVACWYLYAMHTNNKIIFSFVDTGEGIPNTIKKKVWERISSNITDAKMIEISLTESGRSETGLQNRGRGLPNLFMHVKKKELRDFFVLSGNGSCIYKEEEGKLYLENYNSKLYGTIFSFSINMEEMNCV